MAVNHHQLAICREKLYQLEQEQHRTAKQNVEKRTLLNQQIRTLKDRIDKLGRIGNVKMAVVIVNHWAIDAKLHDEPIKRADTWFFNDLDERSMDEIIKAKYRFKETNGQGMESVISISIIDIPLGIALESSLEKNVLSWVIH